MVKLHIYFRFITHIWTEELEHWLLKKRSVDAIFVNSSLWDVSRWGPSGPVDFKTNIQKFLNLIPMVLSDIGQLFWITNPPGNTIQLIKPSL